MTLTKPVKIGIVSVIVIAVVVTAIIVFKNENPGVYFKFKCNEGGDDSRKFYGENWQARGAVCDGLYIPFGVSTQGKDKAKILGKMGELATANPSLKSNMKELASQAANQVS